MENERPKSTIGRAVAWIYCAVFGVGGLLGVIEGDFVTGLLFLASVFFVLPPLNGMLTRGGVTSPPTWIKVVFALGFFVAAAASIPDKPIPNTAVTQASDQSADASSNAATSPAPDTRSTTEITKAFSACLLDKAKANGAYTSFDGGKSALLLLGNCETEMNGYIDRCKQGRGKSEGDCTLQAGILAQAALKLLNR